MSPLEWTTVTLLLLSRVFVGKLVTAMDAPAAAAQHTAAAAAAAAGMLLGAIPSVRSEPPIIRPEASLPAADLPDELDIAFNRYSIDISLF
jgi:hypothetical protein